MLQRKRPLLFPLGRKSLSAEGTSYPALPWQLEANGGQRVAKMCHTWGSCGDFGDVVRMELF